LEADQPEICVLFRPGRNRQQFPADGVPNDAHQQIELAEFFQDDLALTRSGAEQKMTTLTMFERTLADIEIRTRATNHYTAEYDPLAIDAKW
jgi:hypothetical protein